MIPHVLRDFNTYFEGNNWIGLASEIQLPTLTKKMEDLYLGSGAVKIAMGNEPLEATVTLDGVSREALNAYGDCSVSGLALRFAGAHERQDAGCETLSVESIMRGRIEELSMGDAKRGDKHQFKFKFALAYYKLLIDGQDVIEIDHVNYKENVGGVDRLARTRAAIGI